MANLTARPGELRARANELEKLRQQQADTMRQLRILVMSLSDSWKGEAQDAFVKNFLSRSQDITNLSNILEDYIALIRHTADRSEETDQTLLNSIHRLLG